ncbi:MAG: DNA replication/repair protein RecF [Rikenellaceae bacterium]
MKLEKITALNYKNLESISLQFSPRINILVGENGSGKTNIVDTIHYLSICKSLTGSTDGQTIRKGEDFFMIDAQFLNESHQTIENIVCSYKKGGEKVIKRDGKRYDRLSDHIGVVPIILISPYDSALINDAAEGRRKFINMLISQVDKEYLQSLIKYDSLLSQRNKLLKSQNSDFSNDYYEIIDMQLCEEAEKIHFKRKDFIESLSPKVAENHSIISLGKELVSLSYRSELNENDYAELLRQNFDRDRALGYTYSGIHRDDMIIKIDSSPIKRFGSWGQQKSLLIALKLAEFDMILSRRGRKPILLLDDIFDKLDTTRVAALIQLVSSDKYGQIFITDSNKTRIDTILEGVDIDFSLFSVCSGEVFGNYKL